MPPSVVKREPVDDNVAHPRTQTRDDDAPDDDDFGHDIKPKIDGLETIGVNFNPIRPPPYRLPLPTETTIKLQGSKDGRQYEIILFVLPRHTGLVLKNYLVTYYGYELEKLRILYDGKIVQDHQTMAELEVEDNDEFDVFLERSCEHRTSADAAELGG